MPRPTKTRTEKPYIIVFCEGESEQACTDFLKKEFQDVASIKCPKPKSTSLFEDAKDKFAKDKSYRDYAEVTDEIWFFFDVETKDIVFWDNRLKIIKYLRALRKKQGIKVRLLMTSACIEYWLLLHYELYSPSVQTVAEKKQIMNKLLKHEANYKKGNSEITTKIAQHYPIAVDNSKKVLFRLLHEGMPGLEDTDERNQWLCQKCLTFSNVHESIEYLQSLQGKNK